MNIAIRWLNVCRMAQIHSDMNKSKEYIKSENFVVVNPDYPVIAKEDALKALAMAEEEMKRKAIEVLSSVLDNWVHGGDADCIIAQFEERLTIG